MPAWETTTSASLNAAWSSAYDTVRRPGIDRPSSGVGPVCQSTTFALPSMIWTSLSTRRRMGNGMVPSVTATLSRSAGGSPATGVYASKTDPGQRQRALAQAGHCV